jgi:hypothetical protein
MNHAPRNTTAAWHTWRHLRHDRRLYLTDGYHYNQPVDVAVDADGNIAIVVARGLGSANA